MPVKISRALQDVISILGDELQLAVQWDRPSILLAIHRSQPGVEKAMHTLEQALAEKKIRVIYVRPETARPDVVRWMKDQLSDDRIVFFVENLSAHPDGYRALNLFREVFVEDAIRVVFWLSEKESGELPKHAPDFWAFRHRVVEFSSPRPSKMDALPPGLLMWHEGFQSTNIEPLEARIRFHTDTLEQIPNSGMTQLQYANLSIELAKLYWQAGDLDAANASLNGVLETGSDLPDETAQSHLHNGLSIIQFSQQNYDACINSLEKALTWDIDHGILTANLAVAYFATGKKSRAIGTLQKAHRMSPDSTWIWMLDGYLQYLSGKYEASLDPLERAVEIDNTNFHAYCSLGLANWKLMRSREFDKLRESIVENFDRSNPIFAACQEGLAGDLTAGLDLLKIAIERGLPAASIDMDPSLYLVFGRESLQSLL